MENLSKDATSRNDNFWSNKKVLVTGHTGFKGSWLSLLLSRLGSEVFGLGLAPKSSRGLYPHLKSGIFAQEYLIDIRDERNLENAIHQITPDVVFHLAAQASVLEGYSKPLETWSCNVSGTINLLTALESIEKPVNIVLVTTDKVYRNTEDSVSLIEENELGGSDPYSLSKVAVEHVAMSYRSKAPVFNRLLRIATARAGNVIGGGDWLENRLFPDVVRAIEQMKPIRIRNLHAIRPWQHVLDPLHGYLLLAEKLSSDKVGEFEEPFNFANPQNIGLTVEQLLKIIGDRIALEIHRVSPENPSFVEAQNLILNSAKSINRLNWSPKLDIYKSIDFTLKWYEKSVANQEMLQFTLNQISEYEIHES